MLDQSKLVKNMAAAFGHLAPNLLENIKINYKSQVEEKVPGSKNFNLKNNLKDINEHAEIVDK